MMTFVSWLMNDSILSILVTDVLPIDRAIGPTSRDLDNVFVLFAPFDLDLD